ELIDDGVATECARMILPLTTQTTIVMHGTLRSWIHFFDQRCSEHAQLEIQQIAYEARALVGSQCPWTAQALGWTS
ncbi:MAG: FAD-dependent thymidylate synthase, partial [Phycisphaeraceae bacterium]|nr:FAD-dependent thymidylate synthase [Phycisphaeraceae bacterium]